jgi:Domain of unknown function (DUF4385)
MPFDYTIDFKNTDFRQHPELYRVGKGEQGVLLVEPYKSEILPHWRFKDPAIAQVSADTIYQQFLTYLRQEDFIGADMARKFLQMGYTRARRYANHRSGRKYARNPQSEPTREQEKEARVKYLLPPEEDPVKAAAAAIFKQKWEAAKNNPTYQAQKKLHEQKYGK